MIVGTRIGALSEISCASLARNGLPVSPPSDQGAKKSLLLAMTDAPVTYRAAQSVPLASPPCRSVRTGNTPCLLCSNTNSSWLPVRQSAALQHTSDVHIPAPHRTVRRNSVHSKAIHNTGSWPGRRSKSETRHCRPERNATPAPAIPTISAITTVISTAMSAIPTVVVSTPMTAMPSEGWSGQHSNQDRCKGAKSE